MDNASSILEIVYKVRDEASAKMKEVGDQLDKTSKQAVNMSQAFQVAGGVFLGVGAAGVGVMKLLSDSAIQHQVAMANVDTTLKNVSQTMQAHSVLVAGNNIQVKASKAAIDDQIRTLKEQKLQYETMGGKHKDEIDHINNEIKAQELLKLREDDVVVTKGHLIMTTQSAIGSFQMLKDTADKLAQSYLQLGFADHDTELAFAQDLRVTKDVTDAKTMLAVSADLARMKHISLTDATTAMTRAYEGSTKVLKSLGIEVDKGAKGMEVLTKVQQATAGQADAYSHTYAGAMEVLNVNVEKLKSSLGEKLLPMMTGFVTAITGMVSGLNNLDPKVYDATISILKFVTVFSISAGTILSVGSTIGSFAQTVASLSPQLRVAAIIFAVVSAIGLLIYSNWSKITPLFSGLGSAMNELNEPMARVNQMFQELLQKYLIPMSQAFIELLMPIIQQISDKFNSLFLPVWRDFIIQLQPLHPLLKTIAMVIGGVIIAAFAALAVTILVVMDAINLLMPVFVMSFRSMASFVTTFIRVVVDLGSIVGGVFNLITTGHLTNLRNAWANVLADIFSLTNNKVVGMIAPWASMAHSVMGIVSNMVSGITSALHTITFPHISIGTGSMKVAGKSVEYPTMDVKWYENGGPVPDTGLAMLHAGEFVLSKAMLAGRQPSPITNNNNYSRNPNIVINANINSEQDMNTLIKKLSYAMKYDTSY